MHDINEELGMIENEDNYVDFINDKVLSKGERLIYLTKVGSHLYGTATEDSDLDLEGVFLPSTKDLLLNSAPESYNLSSGDEDSANNSDDVDLDLFSIHRFFNLLRSGDTNMYDMLFAPSNEKAVMFISCFFNTIYHSRNKFISKNKLRKSFIGYAYGQVQRYKSKGDRYAKIKCVTNKIIDKHSLHKPLKSIEEEIKSECNVDIETKEKNNDRYIKMFGSQYPENFTLRKVSGSLISKLDKYGSRVKENDIDYTSLYHAYRCIETLEILADTGDINYPLSASVPRLLRIKRGHVDYMKLIKLLESRIDKVGEKVDKSEHLDNNFNEKIMNSIILTALDISSRVKGA